MEKLFDRSSTVACAVVVLLSYTSTLFPMEGALRAIAGDAERAVENTGNFMTQGAQAAGRDVARGGQWGESIVQNQLGQDVGAGRQVAKGAQDAGSLALQAGQGVGTGLGTVARFAMSQTSAFSGYGNGGYRHPQHHHKIETFQGVGLLQHHHGHQRQRLIEVETTVLDDQGRIVQFDTKFIMSPCEHHRD